MPGNGHLYSLDHDARFAETTRRHVAAMRPTKQVTVIDAPLVAHELGAEQYRWYDLPPELASIERIEVLVVDGPPQAVDRAGIPRYPALPLLGGKPGPGSLVFVDDADRDAERRMLARWLEEQPQWRLESIRNRRGTAILRWPENP